MTRLLDALERLGHVHQRVKRQQVRHQMIVLDELALLIAGALREKTRAAEADPVHILVERLALVGRYLPTA